MGLDCLQPPEGGNAMGESDPLQSGARPQQTALRNLQCNETQTCVRTYIHIFTKIYKIKPALRTEMGVHESSRLEHTRKRKGKGEERKRKRGKERTINI